jgi:hypothetical protein
MAESVNPAGMEVVDPQVVTGEKEVIQMKPAEKSNVYDPSKQYVWDPAAIFTLTGKEFGLWLNTVRTKVSSKEAIELRMLLECNNIIEEIMARGVASGVIKETEPPKQ